ncbi:MAG: gamma-glutamyltransferase family protein [Proteobacteria bacterium]|nr:gamma-glutamyltransferase family protein [Pseudomonadota bacterium]
MRDLQFPGRSVVHATRGMAATSQPISTLTALDVLRAGGNAADAAVAACAVQCVVEPQSTGIGGDCFVLYAPAGERRVIALNGSGRAPAAAKAEWFLARGINGRVDATSAHAVTVPGAVDAWARLVADHSRKGLDELLQPAIRLAEEGWPVHARTAFDWAASVGKLEKDEAARRHYLKDGRPYREGEVLRQPLLAATLRRIAGEGRDGFYKGAVAEDIVACLNAKGGLHTLDDFAAHRGDYVEPIRTGYRGYEAHECPPNGSGIVALMMLNVLAGLDLAAGGPLGARRLHHLIEAAKLCYRDRNAFVADPTQADVPVKMLLSAEYADYLRGLIDPARAMDRLPAPGWPAHEDTVYLCVVDGDGNACSFINSLFQSFGSGILAPSSGVMLQNRGFGFVIEPGHRNCIAPRKRPLHTIIPAMLTEGGRARMPFGVMGGQYQPFGQVWFLTNLLDFGLDLQEAIDLARLFPLSGVVQVERGIPAEAARGLIALGHRLELADKPHGGGQAIWIDWERGVLRAGSEPRKDGCALGF